MVTRLAPCAALLLVGCLGPAEGSRLVEGAHLRVFEDPAALPLCPGSVEDADAFMRRAADYLGVELGTHDYYYMAHVDFGQCGGRGGCVVGGRTMSRQWVHHHELVHLVAPTSGPSLLAEGLAEAMSARSLDRSDVLEAMAAPLSLGLDDATFRTNRARESEFYTHAAIFVRYLLGRFGPERVLHAMRTTPEMADFPTTAARLGQAFGVPWPELLADFRASDPDALMALPQGDSWRWCEAPGEVMDGGEVRRRETVAACAWSHTAHLDGLVRATFELTRAGVYRFEVDRGDVFAAVSPCRSTELHRVATRATNPLAPVRVRLLDLPAERTIVALSRPTESREPVELAWSLAYLGPSAEMHCDSPLVEVAEAVEEVDYAGRTALWREVELASGARVREATLLFRTALDRDVVVDSISQVDDLIVCDGCEASADCLVTAPRSGQALGTVDAERPFSITLRSTSPDAEVRLRMRFAPP